jgi:hypothetical protein
MGRAKEERLEREEQARARAKRDGHVCLCGEPLLTADEQAKHLCSRCQANMNKDD